MIISAIEDLQRACRILNDIPKNIETEKTKTITAIKDVFEEFNGQFDKDEAVLKKLAQLQKDLMFQVEDFCEAICAGVKEDVRIVEE